MKKDEPNEFLNTKVDDTPETRAKTLEEFARDVLADPAYRESLKQRATTGKLTSAESRMIADAGRVEPDKPKSQWQTMLEASTPTEIGVIANISRRAMGQEEMGVLIPNTTAMITFEEMVRICTSVLRA